MQVMNRKFKMEDIAHQKQWYFMVADEWISEA